MFEINGMEWRIAWVNPNSNELRRSDGSVTVGMTDGVKRTVFLSTALRGAFLRRVLCHEMVHCFMMSYDINIPIDQEEFMADWISLYGEDMVYLLDDLMGEIFRNINVV